MIGLCRREQRGMPVPLWQRVFFAIEWSVRTIVLRQNEAAEAAY